MQTYMTSIKSTCIKMALVLLVFSTTAVLTKQGDAIASILLGGAGSYGYFLLLASRTYKAAEMTAPKAERYMRTGSQLRFLFMCAMAIMAFKMPNIRIMPFFAGLFSYQLLLRINALYTAVRWYANLNTKRKG